MKKLLYLTILCFLTALPGYSQGLLYFSEQESDADDNPVWFTPGLYQGNVHSNGAFHFREPQLFGEMLSSSADTFELGEDVDIDDIERLYGHLFNLREIELADSVHWIRENAAFTAESHNNQFITRIMLREDRGIEIHQYPAGHNYRDSTIWRSPPMAWGSLFVNGDVEIEGVVHGKLGIGCSGNMWLVGDIRYSGADEQNGRFGVEPEIMQRMPHMLYLVSEKNIIIANTDENGKANGWDNGENEIDRHSIIIDAAIYALGGSFTFQHQNFEHEMYQGPEPDERGIIHLTGCIYQKYGATLYNDNHGGTGYQVDYLYDYRLDRTIEPHSSLVSFQWKFLNSYFNTVHLDRLQGIVYKDITGYQLVGRQGSEITLFNTASLTLGYGLQLIGTSDSPVMITHLGAGRPGNIIISGWEEMYFELKHVIQATPALLILYSDFSTTIDSSEFSGEVRLTCPELKISGSTFQNGIAAYTDEIELLNVSSAGAHVYGSTKITNCDFSRGGIYFNCSEGSFDARNTTFDGQNGSIGIDSYSVNIDSCVISGNQNYFFHLAHNWEHDALNHRITNSKIAMRLEILPTRNIGQVVLDHNFFSNGISIANMEDYYHLDSLILTNNTIVSAPRVGIYLRNYNLAILRNNIIYNCRGGIENRGDGELVLEYNDVTGNWNNGDFEDYIYCEPGEGSISVYPRFLDEDIEDFHLRPDSPCIDSGDPDSPLDPDGSRADMGAFPYNHNVWVDGENDPIIPSSYEFTAYPNPFNSRTTLNYNLPEPAEVNIVVFDLSGRQVASLSDRVQPAGVYSVTWNGTSVSSGIYMAVITAGGYTDTRKLVLMR